MGSRGLEYITTPGTSFFKGLGSATPVKLSFEWIVLFCTCLSYESRDSKAGDGGLQGKTSQSNYQVTRTSPHEPIIMLPKS